MDAKQERTPVVLLAEDNPAEQVLTRRVLSRALFRCDLRIVPDGQEAIEYITRLGKYAEPVTSPRPDLFLLDLNMPRLDGREVLRLVKGHPDHQNIPIVVLTTSILDHDVLSSYRLGANSYIQKPVDLHQFMRVIEHMGSYWLSMVVLPPAQESLRE